MNELVMSFLIAFLTFLKYIFYLILLIAVIDLCVTKYSGSDSDDTNQKEQKTPMYERRPHNILVPALLGLLWLWHYNYLLRWFLPWVKIVYWLLILGLILVMMLALAVYFRMYGQAYWYNENMIEAQKAKIAIKQSAINTIVLYVFLISSSPSAPIKLIIIFFVYFFCQKIYIRIIKQANFRDESEQQKEQTRLNNRILLFFPVWCLIVRFSDHTQYLYNVTTVGYILAFAVYYNRIPKQQYIVTKAKKGSPERLELLWQAMNAVANPTEIQMTGGLYAESWEEQKKWIDLPDESGGSYYDMWHPMNVFFAYSEEDVIEFVAAQEMRLKIYERNNIKTYFQDKMYPIHEYYLWWLMTDVPFYLGIRAFFEMLWDIFCNISRLLLFLFALPWALVFLGRIPFSDDLLEELYFHSKIFCFSACIIMCYIGLLDLRRSYSWLAFYYRDEAYQMYDYIHPFAMYGPTVDGPRNWQYWFYVYFGYFPSRALILQPELFAEEIRLAEEALQVYLHMIDVTYDSEDIDEEPIIWNPAILYRLRSATPAEKKAYREKLKEQRKVELKKEEEKEFLQYITKPKWWTHYSI